MDEKQLQALANELESIKIYGHPRFCNTNVDEWWACLNLSGVSMGKDARATMSSAPDKPKNPDGFEEPFFMLGFLSGR